MDIVENVEEIRIRIFGEIFEIVNIYQRITCNIKEKLGGVILKSLSFGTGCANLAQILFQSHVITKCINCMFAMEDRVKRPEATT